VAVEVNVLVFEFVAEEVTVDATVEVPVLTSVEDAVLVSDDVMVEVAVDDTVECCVAVAVDVSVVEGVEYSHSEKDPSPWASNARFMCRKSATQSSNLLYIKNPP
jgi:hypothetical protein